MQLKASGNRLGHPMTSHCMQSGFFLLTVANEWEKPGPTGKVGVAFCIAWTKRRMASIYFVYL